MELHKEQFRELLREVIREPEIQERTREIVMRQEFITSASVHQGGLFPF